MYLMPALRILRLSQSSLALIFCSNTMIASMSSQKVSWSSSREQPRRKSGNLNQIQSTGNSLRRSGGMLRRGLLQRTLFSRKEQIFSWQLSMLQTVRILLSVQPQRRRRYSSALLTRCSQTRVMMAVPSHSRESWMQLLTSSMISTMQIFSVEMMLRMLVLITASFSKIFWLLNSIAFSRLYSEYSSSVSKHMFSPLSPMSPSSHTITRSHVSSSLTLISSWLNSSFSSSSSFSRKPAFAAAISWTQVGQGAWSRAGAARRFMKQRQSKKVMFLKALLMELLNSERMPSSIVLSSLYRSVSAAAFSCSQRKKMNQEERQSWDWKMMLSRCSGKSWQRSLMGNLWVTREQLNSTLSSETWTRGCCLRTFLALVLPFAKLLALRLLSPMQLNLFSSKEERTIIPHILRYSWFCWWKSRCWRRVSSRKRFMFTARFSRSSGRYCCSRMDSTSWLQRTRSSSTRSPCI